MTVQPAMATSESMVTTLRHLQTHPVIIIGLINSAMF